MWINESNLLTTGGSFKYVKKIMLVSHPHLHILHNILSLDIHYLRNM